MSMLAVLSLVTDVANIELSLSLDLKISNQYVLRCVVKTMKNYIE